MLKFYKCGFAFSILLLVLQLSVNLAYAQCDATLGVSPSSTIICSGSSVQVTISTSEIGTDYQLLNDLDGTVLSGWSNGTGSDLIITSDVISSNVTLKVIANRTSPIPCSVDLLGKVDVILASPVITSHPSSQAICEGSGVIFNVSASGTGLTYQWKKGAADILGETNSTYSIASTTSADADTYSVVVSGSCTPPVPSNPATLSIQTLPNSFASSQSICDGQNTSVSISNPNAIPGTVFNWTVQSSSNITGGISGGPNTSIVQPLNVTDGINPGNITYQIIGSVAGCAGPPFAVTATVNPVPTATSSSPQNICSGDLTNIVISNTPNAVSGTTYTWSTSSPVNVTGYSSGSGGTISQQLSSAGFAVGSVNYDITPIANGCSGTPITVLVNVGVKPAVTTAAAALSKTICSGTALSFTPSLQPTTGTTFSWTSSFTGPINAGTVTAGSSGTIGDSPVNTGNTPGTVTYHITPHYGVCDGAAVDYVVTVNPVPTATSSSPQNICSGDLTNIVISNTPNAVSGTTYTWSTSSPVNVTGYSSGSGGTISQQLSSAGFAVGSVNYDITPIANGCSGTPITVLVNVGVKPAVTTAAAALSKTICSGAALSFTPSLQPTTGTTFSWTSSITGPINAGTVTAGSSGTIGDSPVNTGNIPGTVTYHITPHYGVCDGAAVDYVVTVNPVPTATSSSPQNICSGDLTNIVISNTPNAVSGTTYTWSTSSPVNVTGYSSGSGGTISQQLSSAGFAVGSVNYDITPLANGCSGTPITVLVNVGVKPAVTTAAAALSKTICSGTALSFTPSLQPTTGTTFSWTSSFTGPINAGTVTAGSSGTIGDSPVNTGNTPGTVTYHITPHYGVCDGAAVDYVVTVNPVPTATSSSPQNICSGDLTNIVISNTPNAVSGTTYTWSTSSPVNVTGYSSGSGGTISQQLSSAGFAVGSVNYDITPIANGCSGTPITVLVNVGVKPAVTTAAAALSKTICSGAALSFTPSLQPTTGTTFSWTSSITGPINAGTVTAGSSGTIGDSPVNTGNIPGTVTYHITPHYGVCDGAAVDYVVTVNPVPTATSSSPQNICSGDLTNIVISNTPNAVSGTTYTWSTSSPVNVTGYSSGSGGTISQQLSSAGFAVGSVNYDITPLANGCSGTPITVLVNVGVKPAVTTAAAALSKTICSGTALSFTPSLQPTTGTTFSWTSSFTGPINAGTVTAGSSGTIGDSPVNTGNTPGTVTYHITPHYGVCDGAAVDYVVTVNPVPTATSSSPQNICSGDLTNIVISNTPNAVSGTTYTWSTSSPVNITGYSSGSGGTISQQLSSAGFAVGSVNYDITPIANGCSGTPITVLVNVGVKPAVTTAAAALSKTICSGAALSFTPSLQPTTGTTFSWTSSFTGPINAGTVTAGSSGTIGDSPVNTGNIPGTVTYHITPHYGVCDGAAVDYVVTVNPVPTASSSSPQNICSGDLTNIVISNTPNAVSGTTYTWSTSSPVNVTGYSSGSGGAISQQLSSAGFAVGSVNYDITPLANGCSGTPITVLVNVGIKPAVTTAAASLIRTICSGTALSFTPSLQPSTGTTYSWTSSIIGTMTGVSPSGGSSITDTPVNATNSPGVIIYTITPKNGACNGTAINLVVTVNPIPDVTASSQIICSGQSSSIVISNPNNVSGSTFSWTVFGTPSNVIGYSSGSGNIINQLLKSADGVNSGTVIYRVSAAANGCSGNPMNVSETVNPSPVITSSPSSLSVSICSNQPLNFTPTSTLGSSTTYTWTSIISGAINAGSVTSSGSGAINDTPVNTSSSFGVVTYHITPHYGGCDGAPVDYVVTVNPLPSASAVSPVVICSGQNAIINIASAPKNVSGTTYTWTVNPSANVSGSSPGSGSLISQVLNTTTSSTGSAIYHITPTALTCNGPITDVTVTINSVATVNAGIDFSVCGNTPLIVPVTGTIGGTATSGTWTIITGTGSISSSTTTTGTVKANYTVGAGDIASSVVLRLITNDPDGAGAAGPCSAVSDDVTIDVHRPAALTLPADFPVCESPSINLSGTVSGGATNGTWSVISGAGPVSLSSLTGTTVSAIYSPAVADVSTIVKFRLTTNDPDGSGPCLAKFSDLNVSINKAAKVNAGGDFAVCEDKIVQLNGSYSGATTSVTWMGGGSTSQYSDINSSTSTYQLTTSNINTGSVTFTLTTNDPDGTGPCVATSDQVVVNINRLPQPQIFDIKSVYAENDAPVVMSGSPPGGTFSGPGVETGTNVFDPAIANFGNNTVRYDYTDGNGCSNYATKVILVNELTSINFTVDGNTSDANNEIYVCANSGQHKLLGSPDVAAGLPVTDFKSITVGLVSKIGGNYYLETDGIISGTYQITYTFTNQELATSQYIKNIIIDAAPVAKLLSANSCVVNNVPFNDGSYFTDNNTNETITAWKWDFGDGFQSTLQNTVHKFPGSSNYAVKLMAYTNKGCSDTTIFQIRIGNPPKVDFTWSEICTNNPTQFKSSVRYGISSPKNFSWDFGDGTPVTPSMDSLSSVSTTPNTSGIYGAPLHQYSNFKLHDVTLTIETNDGCVASKTNKVYILDYKALDVTDAYIENFEAGRGTWVRTSAAADTSWIFGKPFGKTINTASSGNNAWWTGGKITNHIADSTYYDNEKSEVVGPCLNIAKLERPMVSINYWSDTQSQFDGAVLQYSIDGGKTWSVIGNEKGPGINWYNYAPIGANPGNQPIGQTGWTGFSGGWKNARYNLDEIPVAYRSLVIFRIAFASNNDNPSGRKLYGFAFDDFYVGEKKRNVLVEHFTNASNLDAANYLDGLFNAQVPTKKKSDFIKIQYHVANPEPDNINKDNPLDPATRALLYSVNQPPYTIMDGLTDKFVLSADDIDKDALKDPLFKLVVDTIHSESNTLKATISITYTDTLTNFSNAVNVHSVLIEGSLGNNLNNIVRKLLPQREGVILNEQWTSSRPAVTIPINYTPDVKITNPKNLYLVTFIQDKGTREIYQSYTIKAPKLIGQQIVGLPDDPSMQEVSNIHIYPNPAKNIINFELYGNLQEAYSWQLVDQRGVAVLSGNLNKDTEEVQQVDVSTVANGIYFVIISSSDGSSIYRKVAIMN